MEQFDDVFRYDTISFRLGSNAVGMTDDTMKRHETL
jgi:hypothetical protein